MKKYLLLFFFASTCLISCSSENTSTYYLIRHAEKDRSNELNTNPSLNFEGENRAQNWANYFENKHLDAVYSTKYFRTVETATPTAMTQELKIKYYDPRNMYDSIFQAETKGKTVLVVGHSNTTPIFANKILGEEKYEDMDDNDNASLYIVTVSNDRITSKIERVKI